MEIPATTRARDAVIWFVFAMICFGLGYPILNRYDPRQTAGTGDSSIYSDLVTRDPKPAVGHVEYRVLVPYVARVFYRIAAGRVGSWNPVLFGMLSAGVLFTATTALFLVWMGRTCMDGAVALLGGALYLLTFDVANAKLAGLVDSGEACFLMILAWLLRSGRFRLLPICGVLGSLAKETFAPFSTVFAIGWWCAERRRGKSKANQLAWIMVMMVSTLSAITVLHAAIDGRIVWPWEFAASLRSHSNYLVNFGHSIVDRHWLYQFGWLLPLGLVRLRRLPGPWVLACAATVGTAFILNAYYHGMPGTVGRAAHSIAGPLLSLSVASLLAEWGRTYAAEKGVDRVNEVAPKPAKNTPG